MKLELVTFECGNCGRRFEAPALNPYAYGEFLLRSAGGSLAYLNALDDTTYSEVDNLLATIPGTAQLTPLSRADVLQSVYGELACDPDATGAPFSITQPPTCPQCGARRPSWFEHPEPAPIVDVEVAPVTHGRWAALSRTEKLAALRAALQLHTTHAGPPA